MARSPAEPAATAAAAAAAGSPDSPPADAVTHAVSDAASHTVTHAPRRRGTVDSKTRAALIDATAQLIFDEGHTAVTARRVAAAAGVNPGLVHYYFNTMNELLLAVFRQGAEANLRRQARALSSRQPLRSLWKVNADPRGVKLFMEFIVLSQRDETIRAEIAAYSERFREAEKKAIDRVMRHRGADAPAISPAAASILIDGLARVIAIERALGVTEGHEDMVALVDDYLRRFDDPDTGPDDDPDTDHDTDIGPDVVPDGDPARGPASGQLGGRQGDEP
jgi:AcrR family transcriptional regulator